MTRHEERTIEVGNEEGTWKSGVTTTTTSVHIGSEMMVNSLDHGNTVSLRLHTNLRGMDMDVTLFFSGGVEHAMNFADQVRNAVQDVQELRDARDRELVNREGSINA